MSTINSTITTSVTIISASTGLPGEYLSPLTITSSGKITPSAASTNAIVDTGSGPFSIANLGIIIAGTGAASTFGSGGKGGIAVSLSAYGAVDKGGTIIGGQGGGSLDGGNGATGGMGVALTAKRRCGGHGNHHLLPQRHAHPDQLGQKAGGRCARATMC